MFYPHIVYEYDLARIQGRYLVVVHRRSDGALPIRVGGPIEIEPAFHTTSKSLL